MKQLKFEFLQDNKDTWGDNQVGVSNAICDLLKSKDNWGVQFYKINKTKTHEQLKGIYKLLQKTKPHFDRWKSGDYTLDQIKQYVKTELEFMTEPTDFEIKLMMKSSGFVFKTEEERMRAYKFCKRLKQPKSFELATKEELVAFIEQYQHWALTVDKVKNKESWNDVYLENNN